LGTKRSGFESTRPFVVVFEQQPPMQQAVEELLSDGFVAAFAVPLAATVAAAQMDAERQAGKVADDVVLGGGRTQQIRIGNSGVPPG